MEDFKITPDIQKSINTVDRLRLKIMKKYNVSKPTANKMIREVSTYNPKDEKEVFRIINDIWG